MSTSNDYEEISMRGDRRFDLDDGETLQDKWIETNGYDLRINTGGSGWTIRNVGVVGDPDTFGSVVDPSVRNDPDGVGTIEHCYFETLTNNFMFVNRHHEGILNIRNTTWSDNLYPPEEVEDALYGSSPGNPGDPVKPIGWGGQINVRDCLLEDLGGYGIRLGSPGSSMVGCVVRGDVNKASANLFGGEFDDYEGPAPAAPGAVLFEDNDIGGGNISTGLQVGSHQDSKQDETPYSTITEITNVRIEADRPVYANEGRKNGTHYPIINGQEVTDRTPDIADVPGVFPDPDLTPPTGTPTSAREAASGPDAGAERSTVRISYGGS
jgi:hypothetical protein